jgi:hypothetical protein
VVVPAVKTARSGLPWKSRLFLLSRVPLLSGWPMLLLMLYISRLVEQAPALVNNLAIKGTLSRKVWVIRKKLEH